MKNNDSKFNQKPVPLIGRASDIELVVDMAIENKASFMKFRNFGKSSLKEVESLLSAHGITFNYLFRYDVEAKVYYTIE